MANQIIRFNTPDNTDGRSSHMDVNSEKVCDIQPSYGQTIIPIRSVYQPIPTPQVKHSLPIGERISSISPAETHKEQTPPDFLIEHSVDWSSTGAYYVYSFPILVLSICSLFISQHITELEHFLYLYVGISMILYSCGHVLYGISVIYLSREVSSKNIRVFMFCHNTVLLVLMLVVYTITLRWIILVLILVLYVTSGVLRLVKNRG